MTSACLGVRTSWMFPYHKFQPKRESGADSERKGHHGKPLCCSLYIWTVFVASCCYCSRWWWVFWNWLCDDMSTINNSAISSKVLCILSVRPGVVCVCVCVCVCFCGGGGHQFLGKENRVKFVCDWDCSNLHTRGSKLNKKIAPIRRNDLSLRRNFLGRAKVWDIAGCQIRAEKRNTADVWSTLDKIRFTVRI